MSSVGYRVEGGTSRLAVAVRKCHVEMAPHPGLWGEGGGGGGGLSREGTFGAKLLFPGHHRPVFPPSGRGLTRG